MPCLGALHWGMEFAGYGGHKGYARLALGAAPLLVAWPTLAFQPINALIAQWVGFTGLWYADHKATTGGWSEYYPVPSHTVTDGVKQRQSGTHNTGSISPSWWERGMLRHGQMHSLELNTSCQHNWLPRWHVLLRSRRRTRLDLP